MAINASQEVKTDNGAVAGTAEETRKPVEDRTKSKNPLFIYKKSKSEKEKEYEYIGVAEISQ